MKSLVAAFLVAAAMILSSGAAYADPGDQLFKLLADDGEPGDNFGQSIAISGDTALIGAWGNDDNGAFSGSVYLFYTHTGQQVFNLLPSDGAADDRFGVSVAMSGATAIVGAYLDGDNGNNSGSAYLFDITTGQQLFKLLPSDGAADDLFGHSVAISGTLAIAGAYGDDIQAGSAYLFNASTGEQLFKLLPDDGEVIDRFGFSVAISGAVAIVGAYGDDDNGDWSGSAYLFDTATGQQIFKLLPNDGSAFDSFGFSVAISGNTAIVGAFDDSKNGRFGVGSAYLFDTTTGQQLFKLLANDGAAGDSFGRSVAISGNTAISGSGGNDDNGDSSGSAYLFDVTTGQQLTKLLPNDGAQAGRFGDSVAIGGGTAIVGAHYDDNFSGSAYLFDALECTPGNLSGQCLAPTIHLLAVGINDKGLIHPMKGDLSAFLVNEAFQNLSQIAMTTELGMFEYDPDNRLDGFETLEAINALIDGMIGPDGPVKPDDTFVFYIAAHGAFEVPAGGDEQFVCQQTNPLVPPQCDDYDTDEVMILGWDGQAYQDDALRAKFDTKEWDQVNKLFIIDSCMAGGYWGTTGSGDTGDFATLPKSAIIAASDEASFSYGEVITGLTYLSLAIDQALSTLQDEESITFDELTQAIVDAEGWLLDTYTDKNGDFQGIILGGGDYFDFSEFYGEPVDAEFAPMIEQTDDFNLGFGEPPPCEGDANGDGLVDPLDSGFVLARFGCPVGTGDPSCETADMNGDGLVDPLDSGFVLARFGECP